MPSYETLMFFCVLFACVIGVISVVLSLRKRTEGRMVGSHRVEIEANSRHIRLYVDNRLEDECFGGVSYHSVTLVAMLEGELLKVTVRYRPVGSLRITCTHGGRPVL